MKIVKWILITIAILFVVSLIGEAIIILTVPEAQRSFWEGWNAAKGGK